METLQAEMQAIQIKKIVLEACSKWSNAEVVTMARLEEIVDEATDQIINLERN